MADGVDLSVSLSREHTDRLSDTLRHIGSFIFPFLFELIDGWGE